MIRKIIKVGNSDGITIPVSVMQAYKLKTGDKIEVMIGRPGSEIRGLELLRDLQELTKRYSQKKQSPRK